MSHKPVSSSHHLRQPANRGLMLQRVVRAVVRRPVRVLWRVRLDGYDAVPTDGAAILCPNHLSFFDAVLLIVTVDRPLRFIGKIEYLDSWKTRYLLPALGMIPIDRERGVQAMLALDAAGATLARGGLLCVFPEGTRSRDGNLHRGYTGAARLALEHRCPILPVGITGTREILPPGARLPRPRRSCSISIGAPIPIDPDDDSRMGARTLTERTMHSISELSGQTYIPKYTQRTPPTRPTTHRSPPLRDRIGSWAPRGRRAVAPLRFATAGHSPLLPARSSNPARASIVSPNQER